MSCVGVWRVCVCVLVVMDVGIHVAVHTHKYYMHVYDCTYALVVTGILIDIQRDTNTQHSDIFAL